MCRAGPSHRPPCDAGRGGRHMAQGRPRPVPQPTRPGLRGAASPGRLSLGDAAARRSLPAGCALTLQRNVDLVIGLCPVRPPEPAAALVRIGAGVRGRGYENNRTLSNRLSFKVGWSPGLGVASRWPRVSFGRVRPMARDAGLVHVHCPRHWGRTGAKAGGAAAPSPRRCGVGSTGAAGSSRAGLRSGSRGCRGAHGRGHGPPTPPGSAARLCRRLRQLRPSLSRHLGVLV